MPIKRVRASPGIALAIVWPGGIERHYIAGQLHREDGPAVVTPKVHKGWYYGGDLHREGGPAQTRRLSCVGGHDWYGDMGNHCATVREWFTRGVRDRENGCAVWAPRWWLTKPFLGCPRPERRGSPFCEKCEGIIADVFDDGDINEDGADDGDSADEGGGANDAADADDGGDAADADDGGDGGADDGGDGGDVADADDVDDGGDKKLTKERRGPCGRKLLFDEATPGSCFKYGFRQGMVFGTSYLLPKYECQYGVVVRRGAPAAPPEPVRAGDVAHYHTGVLHKKDGPAIVRADGTREWWYGGLRHRYEEQKWQPVVDVRVNSCDCKIVGVDVLLVSMWEPHRHAASDQPPRPAIEYPDGRCEYYYRGWPSR